MDATQTLESKLEKAETLDALFEISQLWNCGIDKESLAICHSLLELGVSPAALAAVFKDLKK